MNHARKRSRARMVLLLAASAAMVSTALAAPQATASQVGGSAVPVPETVLVNSGASPEHPIIDEISRTAVSNGVPLEEALADYIAVAAESSPPTAESQPDGPVDTADVTIDGMTAGELEDLQTVAADEGISLTEAIDQHGWQGDYTEVAEGLEASYPDGFSGAAKEGGTVWFGFKGEIPSEAIDLASSLPVPVEIVGNRGFSEAELAAAADESHSTLLAQSGVDTAITAYDVRSGTIEAWVKPLPASEFSARSSVATAVTPELAARVEDALGTDRFPINIVISDQVGIEQQDGYIRGGGLLSVGCTTGFNLKYLTSDTKRSGTAGHCTKVSSQTYSNHSTAGGSTTVAKIWSHQGSWGDIGYNSTGSKAATRTFYHDTNATRYADARGAMPSTGTSICHYGRTSGKSCGTVKYRNVSIGSLQHMVVMSGATCKGGDSGGPWYSGGTAYGIHTGLTNYGDGNNRCVFAPAYLFQNRSYDVWTR